MASYDHPDRLRLFDDADDGVGSSSIALMDFAQSAFLFEDEFCPFSSRFNDPAAYHGADIENPYDNVNPYRFG